MRTELLKTLCTLPGVSGFEHDVRAYLMKAWENYLDDQMVDGMENLIGIIQSSQLPAPKLNVVIMAHMDEVGLIVKSISDEGFIYFDTLGGQTDEVLTAQEWLIHTHKGDVKGYTGLESGHTMSSFPPTDKIHQKQLFIDVLATSREEVEAMGIRVGSPITYGGESFIQRNNRILAKALDDRFALAVMTELVEKMASEKDSLPFNLYVVATTQEELGMRGSKVVYESLPAKPDFVINLDIGLARDYPLLYSRGSQAPATTTLPKLGAGMSITTYDSGMIVNPKLIDYLIALSEEVGVTYQLDSTTMGSTDGCCMQQSGPGIPVVNVGIPVRYAHSHLGAMDSQDYDELLSFLVHFCHSYDLDMHQRLFPGGRASKSGLFATIQQQASMPAQHQGRPIISQSTADQSALDIPVHHCSSVFSG